MTSIEFAEKIGMPLTDNQRIVLELYDRNKIKDFSEIMPRSNGRMALYNLITKKKAYEKGQESAVEYLVKNSYIRYGFETEYLLEQISKG